MLSLIETNRIYYWQQLIYRLDEILRIHPKLAL